MNNPYLYHPHPLLKRAADDVCSYIEQREDWAPLFEQGKMLGVLLCADGTILKAYSGVINGLKDEAHYFVPPVCDLANPDGFYLQEDEAISALNRQIAECTDPKACEELRQERKERSLALQLKIFRRFNFVDESGVYKNVVDIFADAKRGLPPGGTGECAAPRLLQYALEHHLTPTALAEFWYGRSPKNIRRRHGQFYPSCIEKCSPLLSFFENGKEKRTREKFASPEGCCKVLFENEKIIVVSKPAGLLSVPGKDESQTSVESWLKERHPECRLPFMLVHRLDQATSGLLIAAKDAPTHKALQQAFEQKLIRKRYVALLEGELPSDCGVVSLPICPNPDDRPRQTVDWQFGKTATTTYHVLKREAGRTLIELFPLTGRTHQLRLHCASPFGLDHPIVGDVLYMAEPAERLMLHAESIRFPQKRNSCGLQLPPSEEGLGVGLLSELRIGIPDELHDPSGFE